MPSEVRYFAADAEYQAELTRRRIGEAACDPLTVRYLSALCWRALAMSGGRGWCGFDCSLVERSPRREWFGRRRGYRYAAALHRMARALRPWWLASGGGS